MCGFVAMFSPGRVFSPDLLDECDLDLYHRGPDSGGQFSEPGAALVFRRLAILDPQARSDQPMYSRQAVGGGLVAPEKTEIQSGVLEAGARYVLCFNGEIYNYRSLRKRLLADGVELRTDGDTEVILEGFIRWGADVFAMLEGMFAIVLFDRQENVIWTARDPLGIKPLYVVNKHDLFAVASEMRPLQRVMGTTLVDEAALAELLLFRFAAGELSNLSDVRLLQGGLIIKYNLNTGTSMQIRFADALSTIGTAPGAMAVQDGHPDASNITPLECQLNHVQSALNGSIKDHLASDVGYAVQLSGGVDSSLVLALASHQAERRLDTFAVRLADVQHDEARFRAPVVARYRPQHSEVDLSGEQFADALPRAIYFMEGPLAHLGCAMLMLLCGEIAKSHKVVLTGEGADEFFGGYDRYRIWKTTAQHARFAKSVPSFLWPLLQRYKFLKRYADFDAAAMSSVYSDTNELSALFPELIPKRLPVPGARGHAANRFSDFRERLLAVDQSSYLASLLMRQDKMAMSMGVEARVPFTHYPLAKVVNALPLDQRIPGGETKPLLKQIARQWLPNEVVDRRKVGLTLPIQSWLADDAGVGRYLACLTEGNARLGQYGLGGKIKGVVENFRDDVRNNNQIAGGTVALLMHLINIELWLRSLEPAASATYRQQRSKAI